MSTQVLVLNIGLDGVPGATVNNRVHACYRALLARGFVILNNRVIQSDTEPTWAVEVAFDPSTAAPLYRHVALYGAIRSTASALNQEVIAVYFPTRGRGTMKGCTIDHDAAWGDFDPTLFFLPTGERLATQHVADRQAALNAYAASRGAAC